MQKSGALSDKPTKKSQKPSNVQSTFEYTTVTLHKKKNLL